MGPTSVPPLKSAPPGPGRPSTTRHFGAPDHFSGLPATRTVKYPSYCHLDHRVSRHSQERACCECSLSSSGPPIRRSGALLSISNSHNSAPRLQLRHFATSIFPADRYLVPMPLTPVTGHELVRRQLSATIGA